MQAKNMMIVGSALILLSLFVPAATVSAGFLSRSMNGYETDLVFSGAIGFILLLIGLNAKPVAGKPFSAIGGILALVSLGVVAMIFVRMSSLTFESGVSSSTGLALPLCGLGSLLSVVAGFTSQPKPAEQPAVPTTPAA